MFWKKAKVSYKNVTEDDQDIKKYLKLAHKIQKDGYDGLIGRIQDIGHRWIARNTGEGKVLEIGFGSGRHFFFFSGQLQDYFVSEYAQKHCNTNAWKKLQGRGVQCDARNLPFREDAFETVISIYNLEHISNLGKALKEVHRVIKKDGCFLISLPCEGGLLWNIGREITTRRMIKKKYEIDYDKVIAFEHVWDYPGVLGQIKKSRLFKLNYIQMFPLLIPSHHLNLVACIHCSVSKR